MTPLEAVKLTGYLQAYFPQQPVSEFTPEALHELLEPYSLEDCRAGVMARALRLRDSEGQKWCAPTDVYAEVRRARAKAIASDEPIPMPPDLDPDDTAEYIRVLRAGRAAQAAGEEMREQRELIKGSIRELGGPLRRVNELDDAERARLAERSREMRAEAVRDRQAREAAAKAAEEVKPDPVFTCDLGDPVCGKQATRVTADGRRPACDDHATTKPDPEPLLTDADLSREPEPTTETEETTSHE